MSPDETVTELALRDEVARLRAAIVKHHAQRADDRCWLDDADLYLAAGLEAAQHVFEVGDREKMLKNCERFIEQRCVEGGGWKSYAELEADNTRLAAENERLRPQHHPLCDAFGESPEGIVKPCNCRLAIREMLEERLTQSAAEAAAKDATIAAMREALTMHQRIDDLSEQIARDDADLSAGSDGRFTDEEKAAMVDELAAIHKRCLAALASSGVPDSVKGHP